MSEPTKPAPEPRDPRDNFWPDCPYCGCEYDDKHKPGCRLFVAED